MLRLYAVTELNQFMCAIFRILNHLKILHISFISPFLVETLLANVIKFSSSYKEFRQVFLREVSAILEWFGLNFSAYI